MLSTRLELSPLWWLTLVVGLCYANALTGSFQFDDYNIIVNYSAVHSWTGWYAALGEGIRPLLKLSYTLNWTMGWGAEGFHLFNVLIHLANVILVYALAQCWIQARAYELRSVPFWTALLFAAHPVHTEAVSYISGRSTALMTLFYLAAMLCYVRGQRRQSWTYSQLATPVLFICALLVKETAITLPLALLLWERGNGVRWLSAFKAQRVLWLICVLAMLYFLCNGSYAAHIARSAAFNAGYSNVATQLTGFAYLLQQFALPLWLNIDPDLRVSHDLSSALLPILLTALLCLLTVICWHKRPWMSFALAWAMLHLIPLYLLLPRLDIANERQLYLASWPLLLAITIELNLLLQRSLRGWILIGLLLACISLTVARNEVYQSEITLWQDTVSKSPRKARVHNNLGYAYLLAQQPNMARQEFRRALLLNPQFYQASYNLQRLDTPSR
ncbi:MAG: hypothetical protein ACXW1C_00670 [Gallionella sp.]